MLYKFKSKSGSDVIMMGPNGDEVLRLIGKQPAPKGIIEPGDMPAAMAAIEQAVLAEEAAREQAERARVLAEQEYLAQLAALQQQQQQQQAAATATADHQIEEARRAAAEIARTQQELSASTGFSAPAPASSERTFRVEITVNNRQGPGDIINELSEQDIGRLAQRILIEIAQNKGLSL